MHQLGQFSTMMMIVKIILTPLIMGDKLAPFKMEV
jgi:hypothetical protein